jgi:hypothetical protein
MKPTIVLIALTALAGAALAQSTYRWVDRGGQVHFSDQPPPATIQEVEVKRYSAGRPDLTPSYTVSKAATDFPVALYTSNDCGEPCVLARALLEARGVPFTEQVLSTEDDLVTYRGIFGPPEEVPALTVGRQPFRGFEKGAWNRLLDDAGYPATPLPPR